jgi:hypothetical protein
MLKGLLQQQAAEQRQSAQNTEAKMAEQTATL